MFKLQLMPSRLGSSKFIEMSDLQRFEECKRFDVPLYHELNGDSLIDWVCALEAEICAVYGKGAARRALVVTGTDDDIFNIMKEKDFQERCLNLDVHFSAYFDSDEFRALKSEKSDDAKFDRRINSILSARIKDEDGKDVGWTTQNKFDYRGQRNKRSNYCEGDVVLDGSVLFKCIAKNRDQKPSNNSSDREQCKNKFWEQCKKISRRESLRLIQKRTYKLCPGARDPSLIFAPDYHFDNRSYEHVEYALIVCTQNQAPFLLEELKTERNKGSIDVIVFDRTRMNRYEGATKVSSKKKRKKNQPPKLQEYSRKELTDLSRHYVIDVYDVKPNAADLAQATATANEDHHSQTRVKFEDGEEVDVRVRGTYLCGRVLSRVNKSENYRVQISATKKEDGISFMSSRDLKKRLKPDEKVYFYLRTSRSRGSHYPGVISKMREGEAGEVSYDIKYGTLDSGYKPTKTKERVPRSDIVKRSKDLVQRRFYADLCRFFKSFRRRARELYESYLEEIKGGTYDLFVPYLERIGFGRREEGTTPRNLWRRKEFLETFFEDHKDDVDIYLEVARRNTWNLCFTANAVSRAASELVGVLQTIRRLDDTERLHRLMPSEAVTLSEGTRLIVKVQEDAWFRMRESENLFYPIGRRWTEMVCAQDSFEGQKIDWWITSLNDIADVKAARNTSTIRI